MSANAAYAGANSVSAGANAASAGANSVSAGANAASTGANVASMQQSKEGTPIDTPVPVRNEAGGGSSPHQSCDCQVTLAAVAMCIH